MLIHPNLTMAIAEARRDDLIREVRPRSGPRRARPRGRDALATQRGAGLGRRVTQSLRRLHRTRAAEPAA